MVRLLRHLMLGVLIVSFSSLSFASVNQIAEEDGSPAVYPWKLKVPNTTLTDNGDSTCSLDYINSTVGDARYWLLGTAQTGITGNKTGSFDIDTTGTLGAGAITGTSLTLTGADANPDAAGELLYDNTITGIMSGGGLRWFDNDSVRLLVDLETDPSDDDYVVAYDSTADGFYMKLDADSGGAPEGTAVVSTGETIDKYLRADGDNTSSWQAIAGSTDDQTLAEVLASGADANDVDTTSWGKMEGFDAGLYLDWDADGVIDLTSDGTLELHSADWDISTTGVITDCSLSAANNVIEADTVTNATLTTALTVNTGTLTLTAAGTNDSVLTIAGGAVSVGGSNTGDNSGTDDQTIDVLSLGGTTLSVSLEGDGEANQTVDLAGLQDGANVVDTLTATLGAGADANDLDITSMAKLEGVDVNTYIDMDTTDIITTKGNIIPSANAADDLGTDAKEFNNAWFDGTMEADTITEGGVANLNVAGGTMTGDIQLGETDIKLDAALSGDATWSGIVIAGTSGVTTLAVGDLCYLNANDSRWELVDANLSDGYDKQLGICVLAGADGAATEMLVYGKVRSALFPAFTVGSPLYISETAGDMTHTAPTTTDAATRIIGIAVTQEDLLFNPSNDYYTHT